MIIKKWRLLASVFVASIMMMSTSVVSAESYRAFRQENGLQAYDPPEWFIKGNFIACEKNPNYVFGSVRDFVEMLGGRITWLIEDMEIERLETATKMGKKIEYSLFLEAVLPDRTQYWVFVVLPYESAQEWYDAKRVYHGRKAEEYYGRTRNEFGNALNQGIKINAELRFCIENGKTGLKTPEDVILNRFNFPPVFDLKTGRQPNPASKTE